MKIELTSEINRVLVATSISPENGYGDVDFHLLDEMMLILSEEEDKMVEYDGPNHCDPYITLAYDNIVDAYELASVDYGQTTDIMCVHDFPGFHYGGVA